MSLFRFLLGIIMLIMGRRLYWFFLGGVGFVFGFDLAERLIHGQPQNVILIIALIAGVIGALLAVFLQKFAIMAGGFFAGGYLFIKLLDALGITGVHYHWLLFIMGGIVGAVLMKLLFGWTLIILSSAIGAILILQNLHFDPHITKVIFIFLLALGIAIQYGLIGHRHPRR